MADVPYSPNPASIGRFLDHIQDSGTPPKVTTNYLEGVGFKSKNDRYLIGIMKDIRFLDSTGTPIENWKAYRDKSKSRAVLAEGIRAGYADLFSTYPDAYRKDDEAIQNFFASRTNLAKNTLVLAVRTFKALCVKADFEGEVPERPKEELIAEEVATQTERQIPPVVRKDGPTVTINIELQLPATDKPEVYENFFAAMKKHLFPRESE